MNDKIKDTVSKISDTVKDGVDKVSNNDAVSNAVDRLNENEYVKKVKSNKNYKYIRLGAIVVAVLLVVGIFNALFGGDKYSKKAVKAVKDEIVTYNSMVGYKDFNIKTKVVGKNKKQHFYIVDGEYTCKDGAGDKVEGSDIYIVYSYKERTNVEESYPYSDNQSRKEFIDTAKNEISGK